MSETWQRIKAVGPTKEELAEHRWPLEIGAIWLQGSLQRLCPFWWTVDLTEKHNNEHDYLRVAWLIGWLFILIVIWLINPPGGLKYAFAVLAIIRLVEMFTTGLGTLFNRKQQARARSLATIAIYALQASLIFAILEHSFAGTAFIYAKGHASSLFDFLYISWTTMTTLGNSIYLPSTAMARLLQMLTSAFGLFLLGVLLAFGINSVSPRQGKSTRI